MLTYIYICSYTVKQKLPTKNLRKNSVNLSKASSWERAAPICQENINCLLITLKRTRQRWTYYISYQGYWKIKQNDDGSLDLVVIYEISYSFPSYANHCWSWFWTLYICSMLPAHMHGAHDRVISRLLVVAIAHKILQRCHLHHQEKESCFKNFIKEQEEYNKWANPTLK